MLSNRSLINTNGADLKIIYKDEDGTVKINEKTSNFSGLIDFKPGKHSIEIGDKYKTSDEFKLGGVYTVIGHVNSDNKDDYVSKTIYLNGISKLA